MTQFFDSHCHLSVVPKSGDISGFICNSVKQSDWTAVLDAARQNKNVYAAIGVHPWYVSDIGAEWDVRLLELLRKNPIAMVGECGLDKMRPDYDLQKYVFARHIEFANQLQRPIHIHCVHAWDDVLYALRDATDIPVIVLHGFSGNPEIVARCARNSRIYFSFGRAIMDVRRKNLQNALGLVPKSRILIESDQNMSDSWYILPQIAAYISKNIEITADQIYNNTLEILKYGQIKQN